MTHFCADVQQARTYHWFNARTASALLLILFASLFPFYRSIIDIDAVGYLTVARHYAAGEWHHAVNGYWSPLHSWLMAPFIKLGLDPLLCFKWSNVVFGIIVIGQGERMLRHAGIHGKQLAAALFTFMIMVLYYACVEVAADLLFVSIFMVYVNRVLRDDLHSSDKANVQLAIIAAIGFFSKTYGGVFFILHFTFIHLLWLPVMMKRGWHWRRYLIGIGTFLLILSPWVALLWNKYHILTIGYAGQLNWSWVLMNGQPDVKDLLYRPPYEGAVSRWVDPFFAQVRTYSPFTDAILMRREVSIIGFNIRELFWSAQWITFIMPLLVICICWKRKAIAHVQQLLWVLLLFPLVYLLIFMEERYLWPVAPVFLVLSLLSMRSIRMHPWVRALVFMSFMVGPIFRLAFAVNRDGEVDELIQLVHQRHLQGPYAAVDPYEWMHKAAYKMGSTFYGPSRKLKDWDSFEDSCKTAGIKTICVHMPDREIAIEFLGSPFYERHKADIIQMEGQYLWLIPLK